MHSSSADAHCRLCSRRGGEAAELRRLRGRLVRGVCSGALRAAWGSGGLRGLYRGLGATMCLDIPFAQLQMPLYEHLRRNITHERRGEGAAPQAIDGALAGAVARKTSVTSVERRSSVRSTRVATPSHTRTVHTQRAPRLKYSRGPLRGAWPRRGETSRWRGGPAGSTSAPTR